MTSLPPEKSRYKLFLAVLIFHGVVATVILSAFRLPSTRPIPAFLIDDLTRGTDKKFIPFGSEFQPYKPLLPPGEKVSFIMDFPFHPYGQTIQDLYTAQSYLAPTLVVHSTEQRAAIVYCSNGKKADQRLKETGYRLLIPLADGKGIAAKV